MTMRVEDVPERLRYEARRGDVLVGWVEYHGMEQEMLLTHAEVVRSERGNGVGSEMVALVMDDLRARGLGVRAGCSFVAGWMHAHPERVPTGR